MLSNTNSLSRSPCRIPCEKDDDCINHGRHRCCPTLPGSSCIGECLVMDQKSVRRTKSKCAPSIEIITKIYKENRAPLITLFLHYVDGMRGEL